MIKIKQIVVFLVSVVLIKNIFAKDIPIHCGKTVICRAGYSCAMLDGDHAFFKPDTITHRSNTYTLREVSLRKSTASCKYTSFNDSVVFTSQTQPPGKEIVIHYNLDPDSIDYGWDDGDWSPVGGRTATCDATKYACLLYHL